MGDKAIQIMADRPSATARLAAVAVAECGLDVHLVEASAEINAQPPLALNVATTDMLGRHGIAIAGSPIQAVRVYAARTPEQIFSPPFHVDGSDIERDNLGMVVAHSDLLTALAQALDEKKIAIHSTPFEGEVAFSILTDPPNFTAEDYRQTALTALLNHEWEHHDYAEQFFFKTGPLALLPFGKNQSVFIWTLAEPAARDLLSLSPEKFTNFLKYYLPPEKQNLELAEAVQAYPLRFFLARSSLRDRQIAIGSAAHIIHPLAGQGWNISVEDIVQLVASLRHAQELGLNVFSQTMMAEYQRRRAAHVGVLGHMIDALARLPILSHPAAASALDLLSLSPAARRWIARTGAGLLQESFCASAANKIATPSRMG